MDHDSRTLYLKNLNERVGHRRIAAELREISERFGPVVAVHTGRGIKKRGQAFIGFQNEAGAASALAFFQNATLHAKRVSASFANKPSHALLNKEDLARLKAPKPADTAESGDTSHVPTPSKSKDLGEAKPKKDLGEPHRILLLQKIPAELTVEDLQSACAGHAGFVGARMFAARRVGFLDFETTEAAQAAVGDLEKLDLGDITYAKR